MNQLYLEVAGEASGAASGEASGEGLAARPAAREASLLVILSLFPGEVFCSALAAALACRLHRLTLATEILMPEATCLIVWPWPSSCMTASQSTFDAAYTAGTTLETDNATPSITEAVAIVSLRMSNHLPFWGRARPLMSVFQNQPVPAKCPATEGAHANHQF
jgi:hypothetical protein